MGESTIWFDWCTNRILALTILENCLLDIRDEFALPYLDGVIVLSCNFTSHLEHLPIVFIQLKEKGMIINPEKCKFFQKNKNFLGIKEDGY